MLALHQPTGETPLKPSSARQQSKKEDKDQVSIQSSTTPDSRWTKVEKC